MYMYTYIYTQEIGVRYELDTCLLCCTCEKDENCIVL